MTWMRRRAPVMALLLMGAFAALKRTIRRHPEHRAAFTRRVRSYRVVVALLKARGGQE